MVYYNSLHCTENIYVLKGWFSIRTSMSWFKRLVIVVSWSHCSELESTRNVCKNLLTNCQNKIPYSKLLPPILNLVAHIPNLGAPSQNCGASFKITDTGSWRNKTKCISNTTSRRFALYLHVLLVNRSFKRWNCIPIVAWCWEPGNMVPKKLSLPSAFKKGAPKPKRKNIR